MKKIVLLLLLFLFFTNYFFATDIRQVLFGNNYENIQEIKGDELLCKYPSVLDFEKHSEYQIIEYYKKSFSARKFNTEKLINENFNYRVFEQIIGDYVFYRIVIACNDLTDEYILSWRNPIGYDENVFPHEITTLLFMENGNTLIKIGDLNFFDFDLTAWENGTNNQYEMVEIITRNNKVKGFLFNKIVNVIDHNNRAEQDGKYSEKYENTAKYYYLEDILNYTKDNNNEIKYILKMSSIPFFNISSDQPLIDSRIPFMYTLQNAFDGNVGTAYVENTKDDLLFIKIYRQDYKNIKTIKILNGYCKNIDLFTQNNRIKSIGDYNIFTGTINDTKTFLSDKNIEIKDEYGYFELVSWNKSRLAVTDIYKGSKYNDTCVSELDFYDEEKGWIFGE